MALLGMLDPGNLPGLRREDWDRMGRLVRAWAGWGTRAQQTGNTAGTLELLASVLRRLERHRDMAWHHALAKWSPFSGFYRDRDPGGSDWCGLRAGFWRADSYLGIGVAFYRKGTASLEVTARIHEERSLMKLNRPRLERFFRHPIGEAHEQSRPS
jgi:hypothetical protein